MHELTSRTVFVPFKNMEECKNAKDGLLVSKLPIDGESRVERLDAVDCVQYNPDKDRELDLEPFEDNNQLESLQPGEPS
jgi:hypothetical protein